MSGTTIVSLDSTNQSVGEQCASRFAGFCRQTVKVWLRAQTRMQAVEIHFPTAQTQQLSMYICKVTLGPAARLTPHMHKTYLLTQQK